ncbi:Bug family tripartite tricarboxylate transporter substrate binding protein [Hydrogenophaga sp. OTU3427]|uniref:Bug family tripartite tricarboxylate transporter substrate binding protein n=1 Tax=Hydrogenophaga sp. OTU3427 TaxID=3043856 RepID=UPI00313AE884
MHRRSVLALATTLAGMSLSVGALAQAYPSRPLRIVVPATAGSGDVFARAIAQRLQVALGQPVIVEQKPGAGTNIGNDHVAKAAPDGYTMLINGLPLVTNNALYANLPYNTARDLIPVIEVAEIANVITAHPSLPANSLKELVAMAKAEPGKLNYGTPGAGSSGHLSAELLAVKSGAKFTHIPYQGNAQATNDHLSGVLQVGFVNLPVGLQFVKANRLKPLAVTGARRSPLLPDVPTVAEALGMPDYELSGWFGILVPAKTPPDIVARLNTEIGNVLKDPSFVDVVKAAGGDVLGGSSAQFDARMKKDTERLGEVIRVSGAKAQ